MEPLLATKLSVVPDPHIEAWESFVRSHPHGSIFQHPALFLLYKTVKNISSGVLAAINEDGAILGILSYVIFSEGGVKENFTKRSIISGGPLVAGNDPVIVKRLLEAYERDRRGKGVIYTEFRNMYDTTSIREVFEKNNFQFVDHLNIYIDLSKPEKDIILDMHKKRLSNIKRAIKKGIYSRELAGEMELTEAYNLIKKTYNRVHLPLPAKELFLKASDYLKDGIRFYGAFNQDKMIGSRVYLLFGNTIYDWYAGSDEDFFNLHPNDILPWDMIFRGKSENFRVYDFGGAGKPGKPYGVRTYKERFGGATVNMGRYIKIHKPILYNLGRWVIKYYKYFKHL